MGLADKCETSWFSPSFKGGEPTYHYFDENGQPYIYHHNINILRNTLNNSFVGHVTVNWNLSEPEFTVLAKKQLTKFELESNNIYDI